MIKQTLFPPLPLEAWEPTKQTLHLYTQIVGKTRMKLMSAQNHWWHVPLYVTTRGLGTGPIPYGYLHFEINFDFIKHRLNLSNSLGKQQGFDVQEGLSVAEFYNNFRSVLGDFDIDVEIRAVPYKLPFTIPFADDREHHHYDPKFVERFWTVLSQVDRIFKIFNRSFYGKVCPVQLYWHSFDLAVTRFSGNQAPPMPGAGRVDREAYSHEVISFGFWPGDREIREPAFYSYTFPAPGGLSEKILQPASACWIERNGAPLALLMYDDILSMDNPEQTVLGFLESAYLAGTSMAKWDVAKLKQK